MNDLIVIAILVFLGAAAAYSCLRRKNRGCGGGCGACNGGCGSSCGCCHGEHKPEDTPKD